MENGKWKMENGKWKMGNGEWKISSGEMLNTQRSFLIFNCHKTLQSLPCIHRRFGSNRNAVPRINGYNGHNDLY